MAYSVPNQLCNEYALPIMTHTYTITGVHLFQSCPDLNQICLMGFKMNSSFYWNIPLISMVSTVLS